MTEEEKAEEWWNNWAVKDWNDIKEGKRLFIQAYLDGLHEGQLKWHDLRKDPNDLPKKVKDERQVSDIVWIHIDNWGTEEGYYDYSLKSWIVRWRVVNILVIAWCEIPTFDKE